jgi:hypothetical protein
MKEPQKIIYTSEVIDNEDVFLLGRIRCKPKDWNIQSILDDLEHKGIYNPETKDIFDKFKYTKDDPFVFMPLLPNFLSFVPKVGELVWITYSNPKENWGKKEQFYVSVVKSDINNLFLDNWQQSTSMTNEGVNFVKGTGYKNAEILTELVDSAKYKYPQRQYIGAGKSLQGIFAEPGDNAIYGQGSTDIILKSDELLLRAGKTDMTPNKVNVVNYQRGFLQMSYFKTDSSIKDPVVVNSQKIDETPVKKLIEYRIDNLENTFNLFTGSINIYDIFPKNSVKNNEFTESTELDLDGLCCVYSVPFTNQPMSAITYTINYVINSLNSGRIEKIQEPIQCTARSFTNIFPFYYRPAKSVRDLLNNFDTSNGTVSATRRLNASLLTVKVKFGGALLDVNGSGLVSQKNKFGVSKINEKITTIDQEWSSNRNSVSVLGSNKIVLLSHDSVIPGLKPVDLKTDGESSTIYGLSQDQIFNNIFPNTNSIVRGEKLKEFLTLIVSFLTTHTHSFSGLPPVPTSFSGVKVGDIEESFQNFDENVLNQNIRIN